MNWIVPVLRIALALNMSADFEPYDFETDITAGAVLFEHLGVEGQTVVYADFPERGDYQFSPYKADFYFRTYVEFESIQIGIEHLCIHPILPGAYSTEKEYGGSNKAYLVFEPKF
jgi:hypothetical protein